ncbi:glutamine amidotransferase, partial [Escherichia coli]
PVSGGPNDTSVGEISVKTGNNARNGGKNSLNRLIRCVCGKKIGPDPRNFNQRVSLGRNDLLIRTFPKENAEVVLTINNDPLLVFGNYHNGKIACFMSDCSPHWGTQQFMSWPFYTALWVNILTHIAR